MISRATVCNRHTTTTVNTWEGRRASERARDTERKRVREEITPPPPLPETDQCCRQNATHRCKLLQYRTITGELCGFFSRIKKKAREKKAMLSGGQFKMCPPPPRVPAPSPITVIIWLKARSHFSCAASPPFCRTQHKRLWRDNMIEACSSRRRRCRPAMQMTTPLPPHTHTHTTPPPLPPSSNNSTPSKVAFPFSDCLGGPFVN